MVDDAKWYVCKYSTSGVSGETNTEKYESVEEAEKYAREYAESDLESYGKELASEADVDCREATPEEIGIAKKIEERLQKILRVEI